jgi:hypothetical protein
LTDELARAVRGLLILVVGGALAVVAAAFFWRDLAVGLLIVHGVMVVFAAARAVVVWRHAKARQ